MTLCIGVILCVHKSTL